LKDQERVGEHVTEVVLRCDLGRFVELLGRVAADALERLGPLANLARARSRGLGGLLVRERLPACMAEIMGLCPGWSSGGSRGPDR
jgi:hypothetical protein